MTGDENPLEDPGIVGWYRDLLPRPNVAYRGRLERELAAAPAPRRYGHWPTLWRPAVAAVPLVAICCLIGIALLAHGWPLYTTGSTSPQPGSPGLFVRPFGDNSLGEYDPNGAALMRLAGCPKRGCLNALESWSPDGKKLAYLSGTPVKGGDLPLSRLSLFVINADGSGKTLLASCGPSPHGCLGDRLSWSPDASMIAFSRYGLGLYVVSVQTRAVRRLTNCEVHNSNPYCGDLSPTWSPDGLRLLFSRAPACQGGCPSSPYLVNADGTGLRPLLHVAPGMAGIAAWSPNGRRIALDTLNGVYAMDPDSTHRMVLAPGPAPSQALGPISWSPDGTHVLYFRNSVYGPTLGPSALRVANANGTGHKRLYATTCCDGELGSPMWSRDGKHVAFAVVVYHSDHRTIRPGTSGIFVVDADGRHLRRLLAGVSAYISWRPIP